MAMDSFGPVDEHCDYAPFDTEEFHETEKVAYYLINKVYKGCQIEEVGADDEILGFSHIVTVSTPSGDHFVYCKVNNALDIISLYEVWADPKNLTEHWSKVVGKPVEPRGYDIYWANDYETPEGETVRVHGESNGSARVIRDLKFLEYKHRTE